MRPTRGGDSADIRSGAVERRAQRLEVPQASRAREQARVGDGVGGAREQIGEADGFAQVAGKDTEREVEASADPPQWPAQQVWVAPASRSRSGAAAGRASPWLS